MISAISLGIKIKYGNFPHTSLGRLIQKNTVLLSLKIFSCNWLSISKKRLYVVWVTTCWVKQKLKRYYAITRHKLLLHPVISSRRDLVSVSFRYVYNFFNKSSWRNNLNCNKRNSRIKLPNKGFNLKYILSNRCTVQI